MTDTTPTTQPDITSGTTLGATTLPDRRLIRVTGEDVRGFLQGLVTQDVIGLAAGEPDFDTPAPIVEAGIEAIRRAPHLAGHSCF